jgi:O-antigen/teichoic acid export membrane protein
VTETNVTSETALAPTPGPRSAPQPSPYGAAKAAWRRHQDLLRNASSLAATTGVTSLLGFAYWAAAARLFSQQSVGYGAAAISAMTLLGTIGMLGMGTLLIGELPRRTGRAGLVSAALLTCGFGSLVLALAFSLLAPHFSQRFEHVSGTLDQTALLCTGVVLTAISLVFDQATIGLMRGGLQLTRNAIFAAAKLLALPVAAVILRDQFGVGIVACWVAGIALSVVVLALRLRFGGTHVLPRPDWGVLRRLGRTAFAHNWLNLSMTIPLTLIPVLVTVVVSPSANAAFYSAWMLSSFLKIVPLHLSTVLFAIAAADPQVIARKLRFTLRLSLLIGLPGMAVLGFGAHLALSAFGPGYAQVATLPLCLLVIGYLPTIPKMLYIAVCRAVGRIPRAAAVMTGAAVMEVTAAAVGGTYGGLKGLSYALLAVYLLEGLVTTPPVIRAAIGSGRHRRADSSAAVADHRTSVADGLESPRSHADSHPIMPVQPPSWHSSPALNVAPTSYGRTIPAEGHRTHAASLASPELTHANEQEAGIAALVSLARGETL